MSCAGDAAQALPQALAASPPPCEGFAAGARPPPWDCAPGGGNAPRSPLLVRQGCAALVPVRLTHTCLLFRPSLRFSNAPS